MKYLPSSSRYTGRQVLYHCFLPSQVVGTFPFCPLRTLRHSGAILLTSVLEQDSDFRLSSKALRAIRIIMTQNVKVPDLGKGEKHFEDPNLRGKIFAVRFLSFKSHPSSLPRFLVLQSPLFHIHNLILQLLMNAQLGGRQLMEEAKIIWGVVTVSPTFVKPESGVPEPWLLLVCPQIQQREHSQKRENGNSPIWGNVFSSETMSPLKCYREAKKLTREIWGPVFFLMKEEQSQKTKY